MNPNVVHQYFKKVTDDGVIMIQIDPNTYSGIELLVSNEGHLRQTERQFDEEIFEDLEADEFQKANPLEFNLHLKGLGHPKP